MDILPTSLGASSSLRAALAGENQERLTDLFRQIGETNGQIQDLQKERDDLLQEVQILSCGSGREVEPTSEPTGARGKKRDSTEELVGFSLEKRTCLEEIKSPPYSVAAELKPNAKELAAFSRGIGSTKEMYQEAAQKAFAVYCDLKAYYLMGRCYEEGNGVTKSLPEAANCYRKAIEAGDVSGCAALGRCLELGAEPDLDGALALYRQGAERKDLDGQFHLGCRLEAKQPTEAFELYQKAAGRGHGEAHFRMGRCFEEGIGVEADFKLALAAYEKGGARNCPQAHARLGRYYAEVMRAPQQAIVHYRAAAGRGIAEADYQVGLWYRWNLHFDRREAINHFKTAAELGHVGAHYQLALLLLSSPNANVLLGLKHLAVAAKGGHAEAQYELACRLAESGKRKELMICNYELAAEQEHEEALVALGDLYAKGEVVEKSDEKAFSHFKRAADEESPDGYLRVARYYRCGVGTDKDLGKALFYYELAEEAGVPGVSEELNELTRAIAKEKYHSF